MIQKDRLDILNGLMTSAKEILAQYSSLAEVASSCITRAKAWMSIEDANPTEILDMFRRIHDMEMQALSTFNVILEKFPVEHTIQELQMLELFRSLSEAQKQQFMLLLESTLTQKGK